MCESIILHHKIAQVTLDQAKYLLKIKEITERFTEFRLRELSRKGTIPESNFGSEERNLIYLIGWVCGVRSHPMMATLLRPVDS
jgi:hypothetical protein